MWKYTYSDELYHYGKKGMKWGHRNSMVESQESKILRRVKQEQTKNEIKQKIKDKIHTSNKQKTSNGKEVAKKVLKGTGKAVGIGALVAGTAALAVAGSFQLGVHIVDKFVRGIF